MAVRSTSRPAEEGKARPAVNRWHRVRTATRQRGLPKAVTDAAESVDADAHRSLAAVGRHRRGRHRLRAKEVLVCYAKLWPPRQGFWT